MIKKLYNVLIVLCLIYPTPIVFADETTTTTSTTTTTTTTIPEGEVEQVETFDGTTTTTTTTTVPENTSTTTTSSTTTTTTTTTIPDEYEQSTDMVIPQDQLDLSGNEVENNIDYNNTWSGQYGCTNYCINIEYQQHNGDSGSYEFDLPETTTVDEEELEIEIYEVGFTIGALNNQAEVTYTHTDTTTQTNTIDAQQFVSAQTMYEVVVYNIRTSLDTFIDKFTLTLNDWTLVDDISFKYIQPTTTTTTTTTTTLPPFIAVPEPEPEPMPEPEPEVFVVILESGEEAEYLEHEIEDGTVERDNERQKNEELYGIALTDAQIERGDLELYDIEEEEIGEEFFDDSDIILIVADEDELEEYELTEEEILEIEKEMEIDAKELELLEEQDEFLEDMGFILTEEEYEELTEEELQELEKEFEEFIETVIEIEVYLEELEEFETEIIVIEEEIDLIDIFIDNDLFPPTEEEIKKDLESVQDELKEEEDVIQIIEEDVAEEVEEILTEEMVAEEVAELEEVVEEIIEIDIPEVSEEELEEFTEEELEEYEEAKEEAIEEFVEELETEEVVEILEEVNDVGLENLESVSEEVIEVVAKVVEEVIEVVQEDIEELTEEQVAVVAEVLGFEEEDDVQVVAELAQEDENVEQAVEEFVERAVEFAKKDTDQEYTLADAIVEVQFEEFVANPIGAIIEIDLQEIDFKNIGNDMTEDSKQKSQEVIVPTILVRIVGLGLRKFN